MNRVISCFLIFCINLVSCQYLNLYDVDTHTYLNISIDTKGLKTKFLEEYADSVFLKNQFIPDSIKYKFSANKEFNSTDRLFRFNNPEEYYLVSFSASPIWVKSIYNRKYSNTRIGNPEKLTWKAKTTIRSRITNTFINNAKSYFEKKKKR